MADFKLVVGVDTKASYDEMRKEINAVVRALNSDTNVNRRIRLTMEELPVKQMQQKLSDIFRNMQAGSAQVVESMKDISRVVSEINSKNFDMHFDITDAHSVQENLGRYVEKIREYIRELSEAYDAVTHITKHPTWAAKVGTDMNKELAAIAASAGTFEKTLAGMESRLNKVSSVAGAERVAKDALVYWNELLPVLQKAQEIGIVAKSSVFGVFPEAPKTDITALNNSVSNLIKNLGIVNSETQETSRALETESGKIDALTQTYDTHTKSVSAAAAAENQKKDTSSTLVGALEEEKVSLEEVTDATEKTGKSTKKTTQELAQFKVQINELASNSSAISKSFGGVSKDVTEEEKAQISDLTERYRQWRIALEEVRAEKGFASEGKKSLEMLRAESAAIQDSVNAINARREAQKSSEANAQKELRTNIQRINLLKQITQATMEVEKARRNWTASLHGSTSNEYKNLEGYLSRLKEIKHTLESGNIGKAKEDLARLRSEFKNTAQVIAAANENTKSFLSRMGGLGQKFAAWFSVTRVVMAAVRTIRRMISASIELDSALTQLRIVTKANEAAMNDFSKSAAASAERIGASIRDIVDSATTFARLGYSLEESGILAKYTAMLKNVGDIEVGDAQNAITAIFKAFKDLNIKDIESVMNKLVVVGNNFPISVAQIAEGMNNASSSLAAAGNSFEQSVALLTAANTTIQDISKASTGLRTISARIRNTKTELDELGEAMEEAKYEELVKALTDQKVALVDLNGEYRSTYDIIKDVAAVWGEMTSKEQAAMATALAGTRQQAILFSLIDQFQEASGAMNAMENSAGALKDAYAEFMESVQAHINQFKAAFEKLASSSFTRDFLNGIIDLGTILVKILEVLMKIIGAVGGLNTVLAVTASLLVAINSQRIVARFTKIYDGLKNVVNVIRSLRSETAIAVQGTTRFSGALKGLGVSANAAVAFGLTAMFLALKALSSAIQKHREERREELSESREASIANLNESKNLYELYSAYLDAKSAMDDSVESKEALKKASEALSKALKLEGRAAHATTEELKELTSKELEKALDDARNAADVSEKRLVDYKPLFNNGREEYNPALMQIYEAADDLGVNIETGSQAEKASALIKVYDELIRKRNEALSSKDTENRFYGYLTAALELLEDDAEKLKEDYKALVEAEKRYNDVLNDTVKIINEATAAAERYEANISEFSEILKSLTEARSLLNSLREEQISDEGLTAETIAKLAEADKDYLDYLYEENGVLRLNTDILKENIKTKAAYETSEIELEISSLKKANEELKENLELLEEKRRLGNDGGAYNDAIADTSEQIRKNNKTIERNQRLLSIYSTLLPGIYQSAIDGFTDTAFTIDSVIERFTTLADIQASVAESFTMSLEKALEFAKVYPEILDNASLAANGQITLNEDVVNSFISGKKSQLQSVIDGRIKELEVEKGSYETKRKFYEAQLKLAQNMASGGEDAVRLAAAAMSGDEKEFARIAKESFENVDANASAAAYNMAHNVMINAQRSAEDLAKMAQQAHETAKAVDGAGKGIVQGSANPIIISAGGVKASPMNIREYVGSFNRAERERKAASLLSGYITRLKDGASAYTDAIAQIDGQIAMLEALRSAPLSRFKSGSGSGSGSKSAKKEIEEYLAEIDEYYKARKRLESASLSIDEVQAKLSLEAKLHNQEISGRTEELSELRKEIELAADEYNKLVAYGISGNVDYRKRPVVSAEEMRKYHPEFDGDYATTYDQGYTVYDKNDRQYAIIITPILEDGTVLDQDSLNAYFDSLDPDNILGSDEKKLVIHVEAEGDSEFWHNGEFDWEGFNDTLIDSKEKHLEAYLNMEELSAKASDTSDKARKGRFESVSNEIFLTNQLINAYGEETASIENLNSLRSKGIERGIKELDALGIKAKYNAETNEFLIENLEKINELQAESKGEYDTLEEATNALRKETEKYVETLEGLNKENQDGVKNIREISDTIDEAKQSVIDSLKDIVSESSSLLDNLQEIKATLSEAAQEYSTGYVALDTLQSLISLGTQYMQYLVDENGNLKINRDAINSVIAAKTKELALNEAMTYVERIRLAMQADSIEDLDKLLHATVDATDATWGLVYANIALLDLDDRQRAAAIHNVNALRSIADNASEGVQRNIDNIKDNIDDLLNYVMDMLKDRVDKSIDAINEIKKSYGEIIDLRKKALDDEKKEAEYQDDINKKTKELAKLQSRINALGLDDSRDAKAQRIKLEEELAAAQDELAKTQSEHAVEAQKSALDDMKDAYEKEKDAEIKKLEESISSQEKLYKKATEYIEDNWDNLYDELIDWNAQYGTSLNREISLAWNKALEAAKEYGDYLKALEAIHSSLGMDSGETEYNTVGNTNYDTSYTQNEIVGAAVRRMYENSILYNSASESEKKKLSAENERIAEENLNGVIGEVYRSHGGVWHVKVGDTDERLFDKYRRYIEYHHSGGIAGNKPTLKQNEVLSVLEKGEAVLDKRKEAGLYKLINFVSNVSDKLSRFFSADKLYPAVAAQNEKRFISKLAPVNSQNETSVHFGDVYIYGADEKTAEKHREINRGFVNEVIKQLNIKR